MGSCSLAAVSAAARDRAWVNICEEIDSAIKEPRESRRPFPSIADKLHLLREVQFGRRVAEDKAEFLAKYFVETNSWRQIFNNEVDVVYGAKGAGKVPYTHFSLREAESFSIVTCFSYLQRTPGARLCFLSSSQIHPLHKENLWGCGSCIFLEISIILDPRRSS